MEGRQGHLQRRWHQQPILSSAGNKLGGWIHIEVSAARQILSPERLTTDHSSADKFDYPAFAVRTFLLLVNAPPETADLSTAPAGIDYMLIGE